VAAVAVAAAVAAAVEGADARCFLRVPSDIAPQ
jgi:hypothetical protein